MPIDRLLAARNLPPDQQHVIELAFSYTLRKLDLVDRNDPVCEIVARKVIEVGTGGVSNALAIAEIACRQLLGSRNPTLPSRCLASRARRIPEVPPA